MNARRQRPRWHELPVRVRQQIEYLVGAPVVAARNCPGGYSPGFASRLTDTDAILAALSGFSLAGALNDACPAAIAAAKLHLGRGALAWLRRRLSVTSTASLPRSC